MTPFERRMTHFSLQHRYPAFGTAAARRFQKLMDLDLGFQLKLKDLKEKLPHFIDARMRGGSGLQMSQLLRSYFLEYFNRYFNHGPDAFPSSFNVIESYMSYNREFVLFDLRDEIEHLLSINDYFKWYGRAELPKDPGILKDMMSEGTIYSYDFISEENSFRICGNTQQVFACAGFVRHDYELSCVLLAGENPPLHCDKEIIEDACRDSRRNRKGIAPDPGLTVKDRYLDLYPHFGRVIVLTRFDLKSAKHGVRYVNVDCGPSFAVFTDDFSILGDLPPAEMNHSRQAATRELGRYNDLFAALSSLIYLPAFFAAFPSSTTDLQVSTEFHTKFDDKDAQAAAKILGKSEYVHHRNIRCFPSSSASGAQESRRINPPKLEFRSDGYWKAIGPQEIGEDKNGQAVFGRTWVTRHESWSAESPKSFLLQQGNPTPNGPDPGVIYVQRSPAHEVDLYKIGLTRRSPDVRADELSAATGVPLPFGVLATWNVGHCSQIEREIHQRLAALRISPRREFFHGELTQIIETINEVVKETSKPL